MNEQIFERLRSLDATPNQALIDSFNYQFARKNDDFKLIVDEKIRPCFFSGDIETEGKIITISLNPKYTQQISEEEQSDMNFAQWYEFCRFRFKRYESDSKVHRTFGKLFKVIVPPTLWQTTDKRKYLQSNLLNLDWCFYFSKNFPTINFDKIPESLRRNICETWNKNLDWLININEPRYIFAHGKSLQYWINQTSNEFKHIMQIQSRNGFCSLLEGRFFDTNIPLYYLQHSVTNINEDVYLKRISSFVK